MTLDHTERTDLLIKAMDDIFLNDVKIASLRVDERSFNDRIIHAVRRSVPEFIRIAYLQQNRSSDPDTKERVLNVTSQEGFPDETLGQSLRKKEGIAGHALLEDRIIVVQDITHSTIYHPANGDTCVMHAAAAAPISRYNPRVRGEEPAGVLYVESDTHLSGQHIDTLQQVAARLKQFYETRDVFTIDRLTGFYTRPVFDNDIQAAVNAASMGQSRLAMLLVDCNNLKNFNDVHGHDAGDQYLREMSDSIFDCVRETDQIYRYGGHGGDEVFIILPGMTLKTAKERREVIYRSTNEALVRLEKRYRFKSACRHAVAIGCVEYQEIAGDKPADHLRLKECADIDMYNEKRRVKGEPRQD